MSHKLRDSIIEEIESLNKKGYLEGQIAEMTGVSPTSVRKYANGAEKRTEPRAHKDMLARKRGFEDQNDYSISMREKRKNRPAYIMSGKIFREAMSKHYPECNQSEIAKMIGKDKKIVSEAMNGTVIPKNGNLEKLCGILKLEESIFTELRKEDDAYKELVKGINELSPPLKENFSKLASITTTYLYTTSPTRPNSYSK